MIFNFLLNICYLFAAIHNVINYYVLYMYVCLHWQCLTLSSKASGVLQLHGFWCKSPHEYSCLSSSLAFTTSHSLIPSFRLAILEGNHRPTGMAAKEGDSGALHPPFALTADEPARILCEVMLMPLHFLSRSSSRWVSTGDGLGPSPGRASAGYGGFKRGVAAAGCRFWPRRRCLPEVCLGGLHCGCWR
jgi:hypothetical protein